MIVSKPINKTLDQILDDRARAYMKAVNKDVIQISFNEALEEMRKAYSSTGKSIRGSKP